MADPTVTFVHGSPLMVDHTPSAAVAAGDVVVTGDVVRIAHSPIAANDLGALAAGGGVYRVPKDDSTAISDGRKVYWDASNKEATETAIGNKPLGFVVGDAASADTTVLVQHVAIGPDEVASSSG